MVFRKWNTTFQLCIATKSQIPLSGVTGGKTSIEYETTSETTQARTEKSTRWVPCKACKGKGHIPGMVTYTLFNGDFQVD